MFPKINVRQALALLQNHSNDEYQDAPANDRGIQFRHHINEDQETSVPNLLTQTEAFAEHIRNILRGKENTDSMNKTN